MVMEGGGWLVVREAPGMVGLLWVAVSRVMCMELEDPSPMEVHTLSALVVLPALWTVEGSVTAV